MADAPIVHIGENSAEQVAYKLLVAIAFNEGKTLQYSPGKNPNADKNWILSTYAECIKVVRDAQYIG